MPGHHPSIIISPDTIFQGEFELSHNTVIGYRYGKSEYKTVLGSNIKIGSFSVIEDDVQIGKDSFIDHHCTIYKGSRIGDNVRIIYGAKIFGESQIGNNCIIGGDLPERIVIKNDVTFLGSVAHSYRNASYDWDENEEQSPLIQSGSIVGLDALLVGGITIGENCYVAAGEILKHDLPDNTVYLNGQIHPISHFRGLIKTRFKIN